MDSLRRVFLGYEQLTGISSTKALQSIPAGATWALLQAEAQDVRYREDGTAPTTAIGMILKVGTIVEFGGPLASLQFIETAATGKVNVAYYRLTG